ncbi:MAG: PfkB family carbohydrate kinase [bacterium]
MKYDVITIGGATEDITFYVDDYYLLDNKQSAAGNKLLAFDYGTKVNIRKTYMTFGGGAANTAVCFASLGLKVAGLITCGSDQRGKDIVNNLRKFKVDIRLVKKIPDQMSGFSFIVIGAKNEHVAFSHRAANSHLDISQADIKRIDGKSKWLFITSFSGEWKKDFDRIFAIKNNLIAWNPGEQQLSAGYHAISKYLKKTQVLTFNKDEAISLILSHKDHANKPYDFLTDTKNLLNVISGWGPKIVVITNNEHGADAYDGVKYYHQNIIKTEQKEDTTGLGDCFGSTFITGLELYKGDIRKSLLLATHNAASVLKEQGAQNGLLTRKDIEKLGLV